MKFFSELEMLVERHAPDKLLRRRCHFFFWLVKCSKDISISRMEDCSGRNVVISICCCNVRQMVQCDKTSVCDLGSQSPNE